MVSKAGLLNVIPFLSCELKHLGLEEWPTIEAIPLFHSHLDRFPLVDPRGRGDRGAQQPPFPHSGQGVLDPPKDL